MKKRIDAAIFGGFGFTSPSGYEVEVINTPYGKVDAYIMNVRGRGVALIPRHAGAAAHTPPHKINYRANVWAARDLGAEHIISTNSVGTMKGHPIGSFVIASDFIDLTKNRVSTFFDEETVHVDMGQPYCPQIRRCIIDSLDAKGIPYSEGIYVCTEGPRFETKAEIAMMSHFGDVVGMTGVPEVVLAKELGLCYASICAVTNYACGMCEGKLTVDEVKEALDRNRNILSGILADAIEALPEKRDCNCMHSIDGAKV